jgi:hypothetical protein
MPLPQCGCCLDDHCIAYYDAVRRVLRYAHRTGSFWSLSTVDGEGTGDSAGISLALDALNRPHIAYYDQANQNLRYAWWTDTSWAIETADSLGDVGWFASLALDVSGHPHIAYHAGTGGDLKYPLRSGRAWDTKVVDDEGVTGEFPRWPWTCWDSLTLATAVRRRR